MGAPLGGRVTGRRYPQPWDAMGDDAGAHRFRHHAAALRMRAMALLDPE
ncbi:MAG: hypothetical protein ACLGI8_05760 [Acidimicrobiia bacterium]